MHAWRFILDACVVASDELLDLFRCFVVKYMEFRFESFTCEFVIDFVVGAEKLLCSGFNGSLLGCDGESSCLITEQSAITAL